MRDLDTTASAFARHVASRLVVRGLAIDAVVMPIVPAPWRKLRAAYLRWRLSCLWADIHAAQEDIALRRAQRLAWIADAGALAQRVLQAETEALQ